MALVIQVAVPTIVGSTIDDAIAPGPDGAAPTSAIQPFLVALTILAVGRGLLVVVYRYGLYKMAYQIEFDLRTTLYKHLSGLSFSFFDRVQSGQLISRAQSDVRAVQIFLAVAPLIATSVVSFAVAVAVMLNTNVGLTIAAVIALPGVYVVGVVLRNRLFPLSWIIQGRQAEVATVVEESVAGVRVVQSFAAEGARVQEMATAAQTAAVGQRAAGSWCGPVTPRCWRTSPGWARCSSWPTAGGWSSRGGSRSARSSRSTPTSSCCRCRSGSSGSSSSWASAPRLGRTDLRGPGRDAGDRGPAGAGGSAGTGGPPGVPRRPFRLRERPCRAAPGSTCASNRARPWPWWARPAPASPPWPA